MNKYILKWSKKFFEHNGNTIVSTKMFDIMSQYTIRVLQEFENTKIEHKIDSIIFSKDRAMQLNAFIESYLNKVDGYGRLFVLYRATASHVQSYDNLKLMYAQHDIVFVEEHDFRTQLNEICQSSKAKLLGFYVDDMIFTQSVSYTNILKQDPSQYIVCLSRGVDFTYSQVLSKKMTLPEFKTKEDGFYEFRWDYSTEFNDWTYPLGVSAYFYSRQEIAAMFSLIPYKAPNSLEEAMQILMPYFQSRKGLCTEKVACCCVPVNLVQEECYNPTTDYASVDDLLDKWNCGLKIDISKFEGVGIKGVEMNYDYMKR